MKWFNNYISNITLSFFSYCLITVTIGCYAATETNNNKWLFAVYIAADNDLRGFAIKNIKQMIEIGSNENIVIVIHLDIRLSGNQRATRRYYVEKGQLIQDDEYLEPMDSGDPNTLISFVRSALQKHPDVKWVCVDAWNHGSGIQDNERGKILNPIELFVFNPHTRKLEIDRSIGYFELLEHQQELLWLNSDRGVCWNDSTGNYLTNQKLEHALNVISNDILGRKIDIVCFDACFMAMAEIDEILQRYSNYRVASEEVEMGTGLYYDKVLAPFLTKSLTPEEFVRHIVTTYQEAYDNITDDYTYSAVDLSKYSLLERNIDEVARLLIECIRIQKNYSVISSLQAASGKYECTHFSEPSYIDLHHFYKNILARINRFTFTNKTMGEQLKAQLAQALKKGMALFDDVVMANTAGPNLSNARGISIYLPKNQIHSSYYKTSFAAHNKWLAFLELFVGRTLRSDLP